MVSINCVVAFIALWLNIWTDIIIINGTNRIRLYIQVPLTNIIYYIN